MQRRINRSYHRLGKSPAKALSFCKKVKHSLTENQNFPDSVWGAHITSRQQYFEAVDNFERAFNLAINGDRLLKLERDKLWEEIVVLLDEIAPHLEACAVRNPDALLTTGFEITQERRGASRTKAPLTTALHFSVVNVAGNGKAVGSASPIPGAYNYEIHFTDKDPSVEENWLHLLIAHDPSHMEMNNLKQGNNFFRFRGHGPDGPGPWSSIVTTPIT